MAYNENLADRLRDLLADRVDLVEKKMFGGVAFMLAGNMCCGVVGDRLMARVGPERYQDALERPDAREMDFTGRAMRGFVFVLPKGYESDESLSTWVDMCEIYAGSLPAK